MSKKKQNVIIKIEEDSIAEEIGLEKGDILLAINEIEVKDIFDYRYLIKDEYVEILIQKPDNQEWLFEIEKYEDEDLGIIFETGLMDDVKSCKNKCMFCFIDQMPKGMRETLYFKDDDSRMSFLQGNYVTLTNMTEEDLNRIIFYHLSPINISVHTTDKKLRVSMLKNPQSGKISKYIEKIAQAGIEMNFQIVLCKGVNDGINLDKTIGDLVKFMPSAKSLSVVPAGITKYRENLPKLEVFTKEDSQSVIKQIEQWQEKINKKYGTRFVFASDEFYLKAEHELPSIEKYEGFPQIQNGVGMLTNFKYEFEEEMKKPRILSLNREVSIVTGKAAYKFIRELTECTEEQYGVIVHVYAIENNFFGEHITVSGLLTGTDIIQQVKGKNLGTKLFLPRAVLKEGENIFLDDITLEEMEKELNIKIEAVENNGAEFLLAICKAH